MGGRERRGENTQAAFRSADKEQLMRGRMGRGTGEEMYITAARSVREVEARRAVLWWQYVSGGK